MGIQFRVICSKVTAAIL